MNQLSQEWVWESNGLEFLPGKPAKNPRNHRYVRFTLEIWISKSSSNISVASDLNIYIFIVFIHIYNIELNIYIFKILHRNILRFTNETANKNDNVHFILNKHTVAQKGMWTPNPLIKYYMIKQYILFKMKTKAILSVCYMQLEHICSWNVMKTNFIHALKTWIKCKYREAEIDWIDENTELYCCYLTADIWKLLLFDCF